MPTSQSEALSKLGKAVSSVIHKRRMYKEFGVDNPVDLQIAIRQRKMMTNPVYQLEMKRLQQAVEIGRKTELKAGLELNLWEKEQKYKMDNLDARQLIQKLGDDLKKTELENKKKLQAGEHKESERLQALNDLKEPVAEEIGELVHKKFPFMSKETIKNSILTNALTISELLKFIEEKDKAKHFGQLLNPGYWDRFDKPSIDEAIEVLRETGDEDAAYAILAKGHKKKETDIFSGEAPSKVKQRFNLDKEAKVGDLQMETRSLFYGALNNGVDKDDIDYIFGLKGDFTSPLPGEMDLFKESMGGIAFSWTEAEMIERINDKIGTGKDKARAREILLLAYKYALLTNKAQNSTLKDYLKELSVTGKKDKPPPTNVPPSKAEAGGTDIMNTIRQQGKEAAGAKEKTADEIDGFGIDMGGAVTAEGDTVKVKPKRKYKIPGWL